MPSAEELAAIAGGALAGALAAGVTQISDDQQLTFVKYAKVVLPSDGFVFWVRASALSASALLNTAMLNEPQYDEDSEYIPADEFTVRGSLHYATDLRQDDSESSTLNRVLFTALSEVRDLNAVGPNVLYLCTHQGIQFAFSQRGMYYQQAGLHHYLGQAVYQDMATQIVDDPATFNYDQVVSNSLPLWIGLGNFEPDWPFQPMPPVVPVYPAFLTDQNIDPPWISVNVTETTALQGSPVLGRTLSNSQLAKDVVRLTFYGLRNEAVKDFTDAVEQYALDTGFFGIMNMPIVTDDKKNQVELGTIAQRKTVVYEVSYYQQQMRDLSRQLIERAFITYHPGDYQVPLIIQES